MRVVRIAGDLGNFAVLQVNQGAASEVALPTGTGHDSGCHLLLPCPQCRSKRARDFRDLSNANFYAAVQALRRVTMTELSSWRDRSCAGEVNFSCVGPRRIIAAS